MKLVPFQSIPGELQLEVSWDWQKDFKTQFTLFDPNNRVQFPKQYPQNRRNRLWESTCLEVFFHTHPQGTGPYWELNQSPRGGWNLYAFSAYRQGKREAPCQNPLLASTGWEVSLSELPFSQKDIKAIGFTAVLKVHKLGNTYWAFRHPPQAPNFHSPQGLYQIKLL